MYTLAVDEDSKRRRRVQSAADQADLEFDLQAPHRAPPPSAAQPDAEPNEPDTDPFGEFEIPASLVPPAPHVSTVPPGRATSLAPGVIAELSLDFDEEAPASPVVSATKTAPAEIPKSALRAPAVPDLEIPSLLVAAPRAHGSGAASVGGSVPAGPGAVDPGFLLEVDYGSHPQASFQPPAAAAHSSTPAARHSQHPSLAPSAAKPSPLPISSPLPKVASSQRASVPPRDLGKLSDDWSLGLDDLGLVGGVRAAQLDVAVQLPKDDDVPWPMGRTPFEDELEVNPDAIARAGFGPPPRGLWGTLGYAWRVMRKQSILSAQLLEAQAVLRRCEASRDQKLGALAELKRKEIGKQERFSPLYAQVDEAAVALRAKTRELESLNEQGARELRTAEQKLLTLHTRHSQLDSEREAARLRVVGQNTQLMRQNAALKRLQIEERNLSTRFDNDAIAESQYRLHAADLAHKTELVEQEISESALQLQRLKNELSEAEQQLRLAAADLQHQEGVIEAQLITLEGSGAEKTRSLAELKAIHAQLNAGIGAAIVELRGHVPVDERIRSELLLLDGQVKDAAIAHRTLLLAKNGVDGAALRLGLGLWVALGLVVVVTILYGLS